MDVCGKECGGNSGSLLLPQYCCEQMLSHSSSIVMQVHVKWNDYLV